LFYKLSKEKLQIDEEMPIMLYVPYSTHLCWKLQARTKEIIKNAKINSPQRAELAQSEKMAETPRISRFQHANSESTTSQLATANPERARSEKTLESLEF